MPITKIADFAPAYKDELLGGTDIIGFSVYDAQGTQIGSVHDILVDETGSIRYLVIDTGAWVFGRKVLLPVGLVGMNYDQHRVFVRGLTKELVESLPAYEHNMTIDYDYEEQLRTIYRPLAMQQRGTATEFNPSSYTADTYSYDHEPTLYQLENPETLKLYEERLITHKQRYETGQVILGKRIETETKKVEVPIEKERVIIERNPVSEVTEVEPGSVEFKEGEVVRMTVHEESADIQKKAFLREEVGIRKEVERDTVKAKEELRSEELDVQVEGEPEVKRKNAKG